MSHAWSIAHVVLLEMIRRKDVYVLFILTVLIGTGAAAVNVFDDPLVVGYLKEITLLVIWISSLVITITSAARQIPVERESRTIFPLLAKPVTRAEVIVGKFLGCWLAAGSALLLFYGFFIVLTLFKSRELVLPILFQTVWLHWLALGIIASMAILGSLIFAAPASNATICFVIVGGILLLGRHLNKVASQLAEPVGSLVYGLYFLIPHLEWFDVRDLVIHAQPPIPWGGWLLATPYALCYMTLFLFLAWLKFRRLPLD